MALHDSEGAGSSGSPPDWEALARYLAGESSPAEVAAVRRWLEARPRDAAVVSTLDRVLDRWAASPGAGDAMDVEDALRRAAERQDGERPARARPPAPRRARVTHRETMAARWRGPALRAAAVLAIVTSGALVWSAMHRSAGAPAGAASARIITTPVGVRDSLRLPDGSRVILAPGSRLVIAPRYGDPDRMVELEGEGWFDVIHDDAHSFVVRAGAATVRDVGTTFTVRSEPRVPVRVVVGSGAVLLAPAAAPSSDAGVVLHQGDVGLLEPDGRLVARRGAASDEDTSWTRGQLVFRDASLGEVAAALARWYGVTLRLDDPALAARHVTATFEQGEPVDHVLRVLALALGASVERRGDTVVVRRGAARP